MVTLEPINASELTTRLGRMGVIYVDYQNGKQYEWDGVNSRFRQTFGGTAYRAASPISGTATLTAAQVSTGYLLFSGGAGTQTLPTATQLATAMNAVAGSTFEFYVDNTTGSGTCTIAVGSGITTPAPVITGGATLTVANSATQGVGRFALFFTSATAAIIFRLG